MVLSSSDVVRGSASDDLMLCDIYVQGSSVGAAARTLFKHANYYSRVYAAGAQTRAFSLPLIGFDSGPQQLDFTTDDCGGSAAQRRLSIVVDTDTPRVVVERPAGVVSASGLGAVAGTASDDVGLARLEVEVQDEETGRWWDGSAFVASPEPRAVLLGESLGPTTSWTFASLSQAAVPPQGATWTVRVQATDLVGRSSAAISHIRILPTITLAYVPPRGLEAGCRGVDPKSGNANLAMEAFSFPPRSPGIAVALSHNSKGPKDSPWGYGWSSPNDQFLSLRSNGAILWKDGDGTERNYYPPPLGDPAPDTYRTPVQSFTTLVVTARSGSGEPTAAELRMKGGTKASFSAHAVGTTLLMDGLLDRNGNALTYARDAQGRLTGVTDVYGRGIAVAYGANGKASGVSDTAGRTVTYGYDGAGNRTSDAGPGGTTSFSYDAQHRITAIGYPNGSGKSFVYDAKGRVIVEEDAGGTDRRMYAYFTSSSVVTDALGRATVIDITGVDGLKRPSTITEPGSTSLGFQYDGAFNLSARTDQGNRTTGFRFDGRGNILAVTDPANAVTAIAYEPVFDQPTLVTDPRANSTNLAYDGQGNLSLVGDALGRQTSLTYDSQGHVLSVTDARLKTTRFTYDAQGGLAAVQDPLGRTTALTRDAAGRVTRSVDATGKATGFQYDAAGNLTQVSDALSGLTAYGYVPGRESKLLGTVTDAKSQSTVFAYDPAARLTSVTNALGQAKSFEYDLKGNLTKVTDAKGQATAFAYDAKDRLLSKTMPEGTLAYQYDAVGNLTLAQNHNGTSLQFGYDALDRVTQAIKSLPGGFQATISYGYDANGNRTGMTTPWGSFAYAYDALNRLTLMTAPGGQVYAFEYDELGRRTRLTYPNGVITTYGYDDASQLELLEHKTGGQAFAVAAYAYDAAGNRTSMTDVLGTHLYQYDGLHRLTRAEHPAAWPAGPQVEAFSYDAVGNRLADAVMTGYQYDAANRLLENSSHTYACDANGNTTGRTDKATGEAVALAYNSENEVTDVSLAAGGVHFKYDAMGRRVEKAVDGGSTRRFVYDNEDILAILDDANQLVTLFTHGPGIDEPLGVRTTGTDYYAHADGLGSVVAHTDSSGAPVERIFYEAYGRPLHVDVRGPPTPEQESLTGSPFTFAAREFEAETQLIHFGAPRELDPVLGRFLTEDPVGFYGDDLNLYTYVKNRPTLLTDPLGLAPMATRHPIDPVAQPWPDLPGTHRVFPPQALPPITRSIASTPILAPPPTLPSGPPVVCEPGGPPDVPPGDVGDSDGDDGGHHYFFRCTRSAPDRHENGFVVCSYTCQIRFGKFYQQFEIPWEQRHREPYVCKPVFGF